MEWINLKVSFIRDPRLLLATPTVRATWLWVLAHCVEQENGGLIKGGARWTDREWQTVCGVTKSEVDDCHKMIVPKDADMHVWGYPHDQQQLLRAKRDSAKRAALKRWADEKTKDAADPKRSA